MTWRTTSGSLLAAAAACRVADGHKKIAAIIWRFMTTQPPEWADATVLDRRFAEKKRFIACVCVNCTCILFFGGTYCIIVFAYLLCSVDHAHKVCELSQPKCVS